MRLGIDMLIELAIERKSRKPFVFESSAMARHMLVLAQSGSGKSFMLGRLIEELALKTSARILVFDPNSDFIRLSEPDQSAWKDEKVKSWFTRNDTKARFNRLWPKVTFALCSNRNLAGARKLVLDWGSLTVDEMASIMNIDVQRESDLFWCLFLACQVSTDTWDPGIETHYDFDHFLKQSENVANFILTGAAPQLIRSNPLARTLRRSLPGHVALRFRAIAVALSHYRIWRNRGDGEKDVVSLVDSQEKRPQLLVIDLQSLEREEERVAITGRILGALWEKARQEQWEAIRDVDRSDQRVPTFVLIDEAHNVVPQGKENPAIRRLAAQIVRIAAEGRKYGLHLIASTQSPRRIDGNVLAECENVMLMKMRNETDLQYAESVLGFLPEAQRKLARSLEVGDILFAGAIGTESGVYHVLPRRTVQGGRGIPAASWSRPKEGG